MLNIPRRYEYFIYAVIQSGLTSAIATGIASRPLTAEGGTLLHWLTSWLVSWATMIPIVVSVAPAIRRLTNFLSRPTD